MMIYRDIIIAVLGFAVLSGCEGSTSSGSSNVTPNIEQSDSQTQVPAVDLVADINEGKVAAYDPTDPIEDQYLAVINYLRSQNIQCADKAAIKGPSAPLRWNDALGQASQGFAEYKVQNGYYGANNDPHLDLDGNDLIYRANQVGYGYVYVGENVGRIEFFNSKGVTFSGSEWLKAMEGWVKSTAGHCSNLMDPNFVDFGMGEAIKVFDDNNKTIYFVQMFGKPAN